MGEWEVYFHAFLISAVGGSHPPTSAAQFQGEEPHRTHWVAGWVGPTAGFGAVQNVIFVSARNPTQIPQSSSLQPGHYID
jgi:hypothetical protein